MAVEKTLAIIKPDAVAAKHAGAIIELIERNGFSIIGMRKLLLNKGQAEAFYAVHKERPFFGELVNGMTSGEVIVMVLQKENAILDWRALMGDTNPAKAAMGTLRRMFGTSIGSNATHGSDAVATAAVEVAFFFPEHANS
jgi:nucleoside-diphosphate kinase